MKNCDLLIFCRNSSQRGYLVASYWWLSCLNWFLSTLHVSLNVLFSYTAILARCTDCVNIDTLALGKGSHSRRRKSFITACSRTYFSLYMFGRCMLSSLWMAVSLRGFRRGRCAGLGSTIFSLKGHDRVTNRTDRVIWKVDGLDDTSGSWRNLRNQLVGEYLT